jgi:hypothetical protein
MAESFLEEQVRRIKRLTERMSRVQTEAAKLTDELTRHRELIAHSPLDQVRDFRPHDSYMHESRDSHRPQLRGSRRRKGRK